MGEQTIMEMNGNNIHKLENLSVAFNQNEFLLMFNANDEENKEGYVVSIPAKVMVKIVDGLYSSGLKYQQNFETSIGFLEKEV